jgi:choline transport protein
MADHAGIASPRCFSQLHYRNAHSGCHSLSKADVRPAAVAHSADIWAVAIFALLLNSTTSCVLAKCESFILILHLAGFFGVLVPLVYFAPHMSASEVFTAFAHEGGWSSQGLSFLVGFPAIAGSLLGADCSMHMSEEIKVSA